MSQNILFVILLVRYSVRTKEQNKPKLSRSSNYRRPKGGKTGIPNSDDPEFLTRSDPTPNSTRGQHCGLSSGLPRNLLYYGGRCFVTGRVRTFARRRGPRPGRLNAARASSGGRDGVDDGENKANCPVANDDRRSCRLTKKRATAAAAIT